MRPDLVALARSELTFNAPLSDVRADLLAARLPLAPGGHVLDLACGSAELLLRVVASHAGVTGTGVDLDRRSLDRGRGAVARRGLHQRIELVEADATAFEDRADLVLCVGAAHAWGGARPALDNLAAFVAPGGAVLFADGVWERPPSEQARTLLGPVPRLEELLVQVEAAGYQTLDADLSTQDEWDAFEAAWRAPLERSDDPAARELAQVREREYREGYRGALGFAWLTLAPQPSRGNR